MTDRRLLDLAGAEPVHEIGSRHFVGEPFEFRYRLDRCPVIACHMGDDANIYRVLLVGPDGRQRAAWGCVKHVGVMVGHALSQIRLEPFE